LKLMCLSRFARLTRFALLLRRFQIGLDQAQKFLELCQLIRSHSACRTGSPPFLDCDDLAPRRFRGWRRLNQLLAAVVHITAPTKPAVALPAVENSQERGRREPP